MCVYVCVFVYVCVAGMPKAIPEPAPLAYMCTANALEDGDECAHMCLYMCMRRVAYYFPRQTYLIRARMIMSLLIKADA